jgi:hypothetical protein
MALFTSIEKPFEAKKRLTLDNLIDYIKSNIININNLDNLNEDICTENSDSENSIVPLKQNMIKLISFLPNNLQTLLNNFLPDMTRIGVLFENDNYNNSLFISILSCLKDDFILCTEQTKKFYVEELQNNLINDIRSKKCKKKQRLENEKIIDNIKNYKINTVIFKLLSNFFNINLIILDIITDEIYCITKINKFKNSIVILMIDENNYEPIFYNNEKIYNYENKLIKFLYDNSHNIQVLFNEEEINNNMNVNEIIENNVDGLNKITECSEANDNDFPDLSDDENKDKNIYNLTTEISETVISNDIIKKLKKKKYNDKLKLKELQEDAILLKIQVVESSLKSNKPKNKTKKKLISEIKNILSNN